MNHAPSFIRNQQKNFLRLLARLRPHLRTDPALPARLQKLLSQNRTFGARDRRLYRELLYTAIRYWPWLEPRLDKKPDHVARAVAWLAPETPVTHDYRAALVADWPSLPSNILARAEFLKGEGLPLPAWFRAHCPGLFSSPQLEAMLSRAPFWLRLQTPVPQPVFDEFASREWKWRRTAVLPSAIELLTLDADLSKTVSYQSGLIEVQDLGSQLLLETIGVEPGGRWLDACAGAGGKTLQLAFLLGPRGQVEAHDIRADALRELRARSARAGLKNINVLTARPAQPYDGVLVDAPCSGSGTWRRSPHLKWCTTPESVEKAAQTQLALLNEFAPRVRPGGRLVYATCSLSRHENEDIATAFLAAHREFAPAPYARTFASRTDGAGLTFLPALHDTDGFFGMSLRRI
ncbi:MAG: RsmB/NOP family class I SAM-dependent RNA methyltransferase [Verrucomicrobiota bacterium]|nr:RsmB/NOP family class I SAM-dependent RNA methyltransferase [Verrucomicrobiota bacterium]